jgi:hypothetical protein
MGVYAFMVESNLGEFLQIFCSCYCERCHANNEKTIGAFDSCVHMSEEAANATRAVPYGILMSIGSCWLFGWIIVIVMAACMSTDLESLLATPFGQPMAQIYYDAVGKRGAIGLMTLLFIVQFFMGLSITVAASRQMWAFSRDGALPLSRFVRVINQRLGYIPFNAIWFCVVLAAYICTCDVGTEEVQARSLLHWPVQFAHRLDCYRLLGLWNHPFHVPDWRTKSNGRYHELHCCHQLLCMGRSIVVLLPRCSEVVSAPYIRSTQRYDDPDISRFTGPKITLSEDDLTDEQQEALKIEGLEVNVEPHSPVEAQDCPISKDLEKS